MNRVLAISLLLPLLAFQGAVGQEEPMASQPAPIRDEQALAVLTQTLQAAGGSVQSTDSFTASGTIIYFWAGQEVKGSTVIEGKGAEEFSLRVTLAEGSRSLAVRRGTGAVQGTDGVTTLLSYYNAMNQAAATLPLARVLAALSKSTTSAFYEGTADVDGRPAHQVLLITAADPVPDPGNRFQKLRTLEVFVDASTFLIVKTRDTLHAEQDLSEQYARELFFSDYRAVNGVLIPFAVTEKFSGQRTWSLQLDSASFGAAGASTTGF